MTAKSKSRGNGQGSVFKRGATWTACATAFDPARRTKTKGGFATKRDALAALPELHRVLVSGDNASDRATFAQIYDRWETRHAERVGVSVMRGYLAAYRYFAPIHHRTFTSITADDLQVCVDACPCGAKTRSNMKTLAGQLYKYAGSIRISDHNLAQYIYRGGEKVGTRPPFSMAEVERIATAASEGVPYADYVLALIYTGYRPGEFLGLTKAQYDATRNCLAAGGKTEAGRDRIMTISPRIQPIIDKRMKQLGAYLFPDQDTKQRMSDERFRKYMFAPLMEQLDIHGKVPYSCRHTFANLLKNVTGSDTDKAKLMGHANANMTKYYQSADYDSLRSITDNL